MNKLKNILLFIAIGLGLTALSSMVGRYRGYIPDCAHSNDPFCEIGPPSADFGFPLTYYSASVNVATENDLVDRHFEVGQIVFEPRYAFEIFNYEAYFNLHKELLGAVYLFIDVVFWGGLSWLIYRLIQNKRILNKKPTS